MTYKAETICFFRLSGAPSYILSFQIKSFNQSQYRAAVNIAKHCFHWLKYLQKDEFLVLSSYDGASESQDAK